MGLSGSFNWIQSTRLGGRKAISFTLTCTNFFQKETFSAVIFDSSRSLEPMHFENLSLPAKMSFRFDYDTVGWNWCVDDIFAIIDKKQNIVERWVLNLETPKPGECPDCHGTKKCKFCGGKGYLIDSTSNLVYNCESCHGSGVCQNCFIPIRTFNSQLHSSNNLETYEGNKRQRKINAIRSQINDLQSKIESVEFDIRIMKLRGSDITSHSVFRSQLDLKYGYQRQLLDLQNKLYQLENL